MYVCMYVVYGRGSKICLVAQRNSLIGGLSWPREAGTAGMHHCSNARAVLKLTCMAQVRSGYGSSLHGCVNSMMTLNNSMLNDTEVLLPDPRTNGQQYRSEKVLELPLMPDMPDRVGARRREPGMLNTAAMVSLASPCCRMLTCSSLPTLVPPVVLLHNTLSHWAFFIMDMHCAFV